MSKQNNPNFIFHYVDGLCGAGKTYGLGHYIQQSTLHHKFIITAPSKVLIDQIYAQLTELGIENCYKHYSDVNKTSNVAKDVMASIERINFLGNGVIICTQQVFPSLHFIENRKEWVLVVDEIPKIDQFYDPSLPYNHPLLSRYIRQIESVGNESIEVTFNDEAVRLGTQADDINAVIKPIVDALVSEHYRCYTDATNWTRLVEQNQVSDDARYDIGYGNERNKLYFLSLLQPTIYQGFAQVILMGASFTRSMLYQYWSEYCAVQFIPCDAITQQLRYTEYKQGDRLTLRYLQEADWSKYSSMQFINGKTKLQHFADLVSAHLNGQDFIYMTNNSDATVLESGIAVPVISHGLNRYAHIHQIYFSPALNNQPKHTAMLVDLGFDKYFIKQATSYEVAHQALMRTSLRNPKSTDPVTAIVVDKATAYALAELFPHCQVGAFDGYLKKVKALSSVERQCQGRLKKLIALRELNSVVNHLPSSDALLPEITTWEKLNTKSSLIENRIQNFPNKTPDFLDLSLGISYMSSIYNKAVLSMDSSPMEFVKTMQSIHTNHIISKKDENLLFNGVSYKTQQSRSLDNVEFASLVIIDVDNGDLSPEKFKEIFTKHHKHSFFMCNSFSRSAEKPNNYRAIFFIDQVVNDDIYRDIQAYIHRIVARFGFITCWSKDRASHLAKNPNAKFSGIDLSKNHTASFFYIPCKVQDRQEWSFFWRGHLKDDAELKRYAIKVEKVLQYAPMPVQRPSLRFETQLARASQNTVDNSDGEIDLNQIKTIIKNGHYTHLGDHNTYGRMAASMHEAGFSQEDFIELTPYISLSKTSKQAIQYLQSWKTYKRITRGTLYHLLGLSR